MGKALFLIAILIAPSIALAIVEAESDSGDYSIEAIGSSRLTGAFLHYPDVPELFPNGDDGLAAGVIRLILEGNLGSLMDYEVNFYTDLSQVPSAQLGGAFATAGSFGSPYRYKHLSWDFWKDGSVGGQLGLDRVALNLHIDPVDISVGRMPINYSVTTMFAPNDFFAPFSATAINTIYKPGVDALRIGVATGMLSSVEIAGVMGYADGDVPAWSQSALILRANTVLWNFEWALLGGKLAERWVAGASAQGEVGPIGIRGEGHVGFPDRDGRGGIDDLDQDNKSNDNIYGRLATGLDVLFAWRNASVGADYMFVTDGTSNPSNYMVRAERLFPDDLPYLGRHYAGLNAGLDIIPILRINLTALLNTQDLSGLAALMLVYNIADEADFLVGIMVPWGADPVAVSGQSDIGFESEFGFMPLTVFLESRFYF
ncbi:MAG: hypothetical protein GY847_30500 [Proteobacteria bacterium]|nr:hypothetical protein [Pseudomonadota bacterium]